MVSYLHSIFYNFYLAWRSRHASLKNPDFLGRAYQSKKSRQFQNIKLYVVLVSSRSRPTLKTVKTPNFSALNFELTGTILFSVTDLFVGDALAGSFAPELPVRIARRRPARTDFRGFIFAVIAVILSTKIFQCVE
jgi:hypothetical protein